MQATWEREGDFTDEHNLGSGTILINYERHWCRGNSISINYLDLLGYRDTSFHLFLIAVNELTLPTLKEAFKNVEETKSETYPAMVRIKILSLSHLEQALNIIKSIDHMDDETQKRITTCYKWIKGITKEESFSYLSSRKNNQIKTLSESQNKQEHEFLTAVIEQDISKVTKMLQHGIDPNLKSKTFINHHQSGSTALMIAFWEYVAANSNPTSLSKLKNIKNKWLQIIKALLDYGANPDLLHPGYTKSVLSSAIEANCHEVLKLILFHAKNRSFKPNHPSFRHKEIAETVCEHYARISMFNESKEKRQSDIVSIKFNSEKGTTEFSRKNGEVITASLVRNNQINDDDRNILFNLYANIFDVKGVENIEELKSYFFAKLGFDGSRQVLVYIIRDRVGKMIGFNCLELHETIYQGKQCIISYGSLAYLDKNYQGLGLTTPLSFGCIHALRIALKDLVEIEFYVMFDAIHLNSYRLIYELPHYPKFRCELGEDFVKHVIKVIYGIERANEFDGKEHFYFKTKSSVKQNMPEYKKYDLPWLIDFFNELTENKGGIPVIFPVTDFTHNYYAGKLNINFDEYCKQLGDYLLKKEFASQFLCTVKINPEKTDCLLWPACDTEQHSLKPL